MIEPYQNWCTYLGQAEVDVAKRDEVPIQKATAFWSQGAPASFLSAATVKKLEAQPDLPEMGIGFDG